MTIPTVAISVDGVCAYQNKCFVSDIVAVAEQFNVPLTWLLAVDEHDPLSNVKLYHNEYLHRIPAWHEIGLYLTFDASAGNTVERGDMVRLGKDILKQYSIKPTSFRAANGDLEPSDLKALEDIGILVDSTPGSSSGRPLSAPKIPYHPSYDNVHEVGNAKLWVVPVSSAGSIRGYIDAGLERLKPVIESHLANSPVISLAVSDCSDAAKDLAAVIGYLKEKQARFVTLTQLVSEL